MSPPQISGISPPTVEPIKIPIQMDDPMLSSVTRKDESVGHAQAGNCQISKSLRLLFGLIVLRPRRFPRPFGLPSIVSGVPRRGGTPGGRPPIHCGMSAIRSLMLAAVRSTLAQDDSNNPAEHVRSDLMPIVAASFPLRLQPEFVKPRLLDPKRPSVTRRI
jgi:hypothetical protein